MEPLLTTREAVRLALVRHSVRDDETLALAFQHALKLSAHTLKVERVGLWLFEKEEASIRCIAQYTLAHGKEPALEEIDLRTCPAYAEAIRSRRMVAAAEALIDPRTRELEPYLKAHGISSMLDSPVFRQGEPLGIVCHEHVGEPRTWSPDECHFAATIADMLGLYFEQHESQAHYRELVEARRRLEEQRVMESIGRFSAAIAHDFNNVLGAIGLKAELLSGLLAKHGIPASHSEEVLALVAQGSRLVGQLFDLGHKDPPSDEVIDLAEVVRSMQPMLATFEARGISSELKLPQQKAPIRLLRSRAEQVLMNLLVNARDALIGGGRLTVEVSLRDASEDMQASVVLRVGDTGVGMDADTRERLFEPFFTTKAEGKGQGLGLATVYRIVQTSLGAIEIRSEPGEGTDFIIHWPRAGASR
jgi:signal transduction histidine kinase